MAYRIKPGDTLGAIAKRYKTTVSNLMKLNPNIKNPNLIRAGASLNVSGSSTPKAPKPNTTQTRAAEIAKGAEKAVNFEQRFPFEKYFFNEGVARRQAEEQANPYFDPIEQRGVRDIRRDFAGRGLFRSGARQSGQDLFRQDIGEQRELTMRELIGNRMDEAIQQQNIFQKLAEEGNMDEFNRAIGALKPIDTSILNRPQSQFDVLTGRRTSPIGFSPVNRGGIPAPSTGTIFSPITGETRGTPDRRVLPMSIRNLLR